MAVAGAAEREAGAVGAGREEPGAVGGEREGPEGGVREGGVWEARVE